MGDVGGCGRVVIGGDAERTGHCAELIGGDAAPLRTHDDGGVPGGSRIAVLPPPECALRHCPQDSAAVECEGLVPVDGEGIGYLEGVVVGAPVLGGDLARGGVENDRDDDVRVVQTRALHPYGDVAGIGTDDQGFVPGVPAPVHVVGVALVGPPDGAVLPVERGDALGRQDDRAGRARDDIQERADVIGPVDVLVVLVILAASARAGRTGGRLGVGRGRRPGGRVEQGGRH